MEKLLSPAEVCEIVPGMSENLLAQMRFRGDGPRFIKPSPRKVVYRSSVVEAWLQSREQTSTRETAAAS
jgi:predicted DNA-binding transcriptional regulator AlpA